VRTLVTNRRDFFFAVAIAVAGLAHYLYAQSGNVYAQNDKAISSASLRVNDAALIGHPENDDPWSADELIQPEELAKSLTREQKPVVLQIGVVYLYRIGHIPGAKFVGPVGSPEGLEALKKATREVSRDSQIIAYCGCCPWGDCPNIRPAYEALHKMGFKKIRMLYLPNTFAQDWATKGYPVEKGGA
jgi:thiosulfate/3-mercaptopyruvate sulfurtransferase